MTSLSRALLTTRDGYPAFTEKWEHKSTCENLEDVYHVGHVLLRNAHSKGIVVQEILVLHLDAVLRDCSTLQVIAEHHKTAHHNTAKHTTSQQNTQQESTEHHDTLPCFQEEDPVGCIDERKGRRTLRWGQMRPCGTSPLPWDLRQGNIPG